MLQAFIVCRQKLLIDYTIKNKLTKCMIQFNNHQYTATSFMTFSVSADQTA